MKSNSLLSSQNHQRIDYLDGWRGLAIILVLLSHFFNIPFTPLLGRLGVDLFFVLSGLLISKILFVERAPLKYYAVRRASRILPAFVFFTLIIHLLSYLFQFSNEHKNVIFTLLTIRNYIPEQPDVWNTGLAMGHLWTLNVEIHCYILLGVIASMSFLKGREHWLLLSLGFLCLVMTYLYGNHYLTQPPLYSLRTESAASHILFSSGYVLIKDRLKPYVQSWMPITSLLVAFVLYSDFSPYGAFYWLLSPFLLAFAVNHLDMSLKTVLQVFSFKPLRYIGIYSFSIYLWQEPIFIYSDKIMDPFWGRSVLLFTVAIILGIVSFYLIEQPTRKKINGIFKKKEVGQATPVKQQKLDKI